VRRRRAGRQQDARVQLTGLAAKHPEAIAVRVGLSRLLASSGNVTGALEQVVPLVDAFPADPRPAEQAAAILADLGDAVRLRPLAEHLAHRWPHRPSGTYFSGTVAFVEGRPDDAERLAQIGVRTHPTEARLQTLLGVASASLGHRDAARTAFEATLSLSPRDPVSYANVGQFDLEGGAVESAINRFAEALILDPSSGPALQGLARALRQAGHPDRAARVEQTAQTDRRR
jgi:Flp pilus assembly protein TadD